MIALRRFLKPRQMRLKLFLVEPARAVNARQHRILLIATPICARNPRQRECLRVELASGGQMRPAAHVEPVAARSEEHTSELQSLMRLSHADCCMKTKEMTRPRTNT